MSEGTKVFLWMGTPIADVPRDELERAAEWMAARISSLIDERNSAEIASLRAAAFMHPRRRGWRWPYGDLP